MASRSAKLMVAATGLAVVLTWTPSVWPSSGKPAYAQAAGSSTPAAPTSPVPATSPAVAPAATASVPGSPAAGSAAPVASPTPAAEAACKKALKSLGAGDRSAFKSLPPETQAALARNGGEASLLAFTCLAIAEGSTSYCDSLPEEFKRKCTERLQLVSELKGLPKDELKPHLLRHVCMGTGGSKADCDKLRVAVATHNTAKCSNLPPPWGGGFCVALASGDAATCNKAPDPSKRDGCIALVTDDPSRCPKDAPDCVSMASSFADFKKGGLDAAGKGDPIIAAARKGKKACAPLLARLEQVCAPQPSAPAASTPASAAATPVPSP
jgi:hypothetical protein